MSPRWIQRDRHPARAMGAAPALPCLSDAKRGDTGMYCGRAFGYKRGHCLKVGDYEPPSEMRVIVEIRDTQG